MPSSSSTASSLAAVILHLLLLTCAFRPMSSSSTLHHRRILHQPFLPQDSSPPSPPPTPSPPKYPFTSSTPDNSPFFQSYPSPPSPPSPASLATFPANISSLSVPRPSKPHSASNKLIIAAVAAVIAAVAVVSLSVFLHLRKRNSTHGSSSFCESKTQRSDSCSTISYNQTPNTHHIPKLQRPSQTSSEFLYIGTLVNTHAPGGGAAFNGSTTSTNIYSNAPNTRKLDSPELHPLPPLNIQQGLRQNFRNNAEVVSSKDDESEEFYSPKGSIIGKESSIGTGTASRRAFAAIEVENFNGSSSNSSSTYSSSVPGSGSASPVRSLSSSLSPANNMSPINSIPKSPDLIEIQTTASVPARTGSPPLVTQASLLHESASPSPPSSSPERYSRRSDESSPRISNASGQDVESPARSNSEIQQNTTVFPTPQEILGLMLPQSAPMLLPSSPSPERCLGRNEDLSPRNSGVLDQHVESLVRISGHAQNNSTVGSVAEAPEMKPFVFPESTSSLPPISLSPDRSMRSEESSPRNSNVWDQSVECPMSPARHDSTVNTTASEIQLSPISSTPERGLKSEESSPRNLNVLDQNMESPVRISSPAQHISNEIPISPEMQALVSQESALPLLSPSGSSSPQRHSRENEELSPRISNASDRDVEPPVSSPVQPEMQDLVLLSPERKLRRSKESTPRVPDVSNENVASLVRFSSTELHKPSPPNSSSLPEPRISDVPDEKVAPPMSISSTELHKSPSPISSSLPAPRMSNVSDENVASLRISSPEMHKPPLPISLSLPEKYLNGSEESSSRILNDSEQPMESPERNCSSEQHNATSIPTCLSPPVYVPPPPPPPPPPPLSRAWPSPKTPTPMAKLPIVPPTLKNPLKPIAFESPTFISPIQLPSNDSPTVKNDEGKESPDKGTEYSSENAESPPKPKLKPLHWDKVRASSDREMVWDQLKCSSFELNEEMIETLFIVNTSKPNPKETTKWQVLPSPGQDNGDRVLDPKKAQNIAILLKALHVTVDEVCEGLLEGNADILGTELLESLLKMAPTKEEERKLKEYKDDSPIKLGPAERFLKAVVDIPHAFRRLEAMLYISNFESEVEYLKKSFTTLEAACEELRTSRMFLKLLEAVLKTGNRMNVGTNRGDAHAFKLDTLLKLVDVKGADGKTTLLHFVVQEIIRSEGARLSGEGPQEKNDDAKCRKLGLQVVSALSSELSNVKKAAVMDAEMLITDVSKLSKGIADVREVIKLNEDDNTKFSDNIRSFIERAEEEICRTQAQESLALSLVKEITEYFHGNSALEEAHPFRIFTVVKDFLTVLDRVCKEVGLINERTIVSLAHKFPVPVNPMLQQVPVAFHNRQCTSSDDESLPFNA